jgi:hypothetical protein
MARDQHGQVSMRTVTGIFTAQADAEAAVLALRGEGIPPDRITLLTPDRTPRAVDRVPTTEAEPPGLGRTLGAVVGGAAGAAGGIQAAVL